MDAKQKVVDAVRELHSRLGQIERGVPEEEVPKEEADTVNRALDVFVDVCWEVLQESDKKFKGTKPLKTFLKAAKDLKPGTEYPPLPPEIEGRRAALDEAATYTDKGSAQHAALVCLALLAMKNRRLLYTTLPSPEAVYVDLHTSAHVYALRAMNLEGIDPDNKLQPACTGPDVIDLCRNKIAKALGVEFNDPDY